MSTLHRRRRAITAKLTATLSAGILLLSGCGSTAPTNEASTPADAGQTSGPTESEAPAEVIPMTVSRGQVNIENAIIALEDNYFSDAGLDVTLEVSQGAAPTNAAVISGEFNVALTDPTAAIRAIDEGMPITVVAGTKYADPNFTGGQSDGVLLPPGSTVKTWADLAGKKVGVADLGGLGQLMILKAVADDGGDPASVEFIQLPIPALAESAAKGEVDAVFLFSVFYFGALQNGFTPLGTGVAEILPDAPQAVWIASTDYVANNPDAIERFRAALDKASQYGNENQDAVRAVYHANTELPAEFIDNAMVLPKLSIELPKDGWDLILQVMHDNSELSKPLTYEDIVWEGARQ